MPCASGTALPGVEEPVELHLDLRTEKGGLKGCLNCGHPELFTRKVFPVKVGMAIVAVAAILVLALPQPMSYIALAVAALDRLHPLSRRARRGRLLQLRHRAPWLRQDAEAPALRSDDRRAS